MRNAANCGTLYRATEQDSMSSFKVGDRVKIIDLFNPKFYNRIGVIQSITHHTWTEDKYQVEFNVHESDWFTTDEFILEANVDYSYDYDYKPKPINCFHRWKPVLLLSKTVFDCEKCGAKKEDVEQEEF